MCIYLSLSLSIYIYIYTHTYTCTHTHISPCPQSVPKAEGKLDNQTKVLNGFISNVNQLRGEERPTIPARLII